jgi:hypothetical protein
MSHGACGERTWVLWVGESGVLVPPVLFGGLEVGHFGARVGLAAQGLVEAEGALGGAVDVVGGYSNAAFADLGGGRLNPEQLLLPGRF